MRADGSWGTWQDNCAELHAVQDADRLDAIGGIGVLRCAAFSGVRGRYLLEDKPGAGKGCEGHFYEKLLRIREFMKTGVGREEAERRHAAVSFARRLGVRSGCLLTLQMVDFLAALDRERDWA